MLVTCCFLALSSPFQDVLSFVRTPISPHNPTVKSASSLFWGTFLRIISDPSLLDCEEESQKNPLARICAGLLPSADLQQFGITSFFTQLGPRLLLIKEKKSWKIFPILSRKYDKDCSIHGFITLQLVCLVSWNFISGDGGVSCTSHPTLPLCTAIDSLWTLAEGQLLGRETVFVLLLSGLPSEESKLLKA